MKIHKSNQKKLLSSYSLLTYAYTCMSRISLFQAFCWWLFYDCWKACQHILWASLQVDFKTIASVFIMELFWNNTIGSNRIDLKCSSQYVWTSIPPRSQLTPCFHQLQNNHQQKAWNILEQNILWLIKFTITHSCQNLHALMQPHLFQESFLGIDGIHSYH